MGWNLNTIRDMFKRRAEKELTSLTKEELIDKLVELQTATYPFIYVLGSLNRESWRGTHITSKLFPLYNKEGKFDVFKGDGTTVVCSWVSMDGIEESQLHEHEYDVRESMRIMNGANLHDDFEIIEAHQQAPGAYIGCGSITMGDVRRLFGLVNIADPDGE